MVSSAFLEPRCIPAERVGFWQDVSVRPYFHGPSSEPVLCSGKVGHRLRYAGRNFEECPYDHLRSYSLDAVDRSDGHILESVHPGIGGVVTTGATVDVNSCRAVAGDRP